jgi:hypothetical protein
MRKNASEPPSAGGLLFVEGNRRYEIYGALQDSVAELFAVVVGFGLVFYSEARKINLASLCISVPYTLIIYVNSCRFSWALSIIRTNLYISFSILEKITSGSIFIALQIVNIMPFISDYLISQAASNRISQIPKEFGHILYPLPKREKIGFLVTIIP